MLHLKYTYVAISAGKYSKLSIKLEKQYFCGLLMNAFETNSNANPQNKIFELTKIQINNDYISVFFEGRF